MSSRESLATTACAAVHGDDGRVIRTDDPSLRARQLSICDSRIAMFRDGLDIDLLRLGNTQFLQEIYGVDRAALGRSGPSVVSINGVVASLAVTEFMVTATGLRAPKPALNYYGKLGRLTSPVDPPAPDCYYCLAVKSRRDEADVQHYLRDKIGAFLR